MVGWNRLRKQAGELLLLAGLMSQMSFLAIFVVLVTLSLKHLKQP